MIEPGTFDLAIVGSGFGGSLLAMIAQRLGLSVLLLERGKHPRFAIGESTSPLANLLIEQLARRYDLPRLLPLTTHGNWLRAYPHLRCGLKRGFTFYGHEAGKPYQSTKDRSNELLVAASPRDDMADTHWLRSDVDAFLKDEAVALGVVYCDAAELEAPEWGAQGGATKLRGNRQGKPFTFRCRLLIDATGPRGFMSRHGVREATSPSCRGQQTLYSHFTGVARVADMAEFATPDVPPYPPDAAALHHVFDGGWMWVLRFDDGVTSAGIALTNDLAESLGLREGEPAWTRFLARFPTIARQFGGARAIRPFTYGPRFPYRAAQAVGDGWAMLPSAAAFVDPLFSTGFALTLLGIERLAAILSESWRDQEAFRARLSDYESRTLREADATERYIATCYAAMRNFPRFTQMSMFYFAAASYSELARRLGRAELANEFLLSGNSGFGASIERAASVGAGSERDLSRAVAEGIEQFNVAGLAEPAKRNWYPLDLADVVSGAEKLGMTREQMREALRTAEWV